jgi:hypothetical protein
MLECGVNMLSGNVFEREFVVCVYCSVEYKYVEGKHVELGIVEREYVGLNMLIVNMLSGNVECNHECKLGSIDVSVYMYVYLYVEFISTNTQRQHNQFI